MGRLVRSSPARWCFMAGCRPGQRALGEPARRLVDFTKNTFEGRGFGFSPVFSLGLSECVPTTCTDKGPCRIIKLLILLILW